VAFVVHSKKSPQIENNASPVKENEEKKTKKKSSHLRREPDDVTLEEPELNEEQEAQEKSHFEEETEVKNDKDLLQDLKEKSKSSKSNFQKEMEEEEADREQLDMKIMNVKNEVNMQENMLVNNVKGKLEKEMKESEKNLKRVMDKYLKDEKKSKEEILKIEEDVIARVEEKVKNQIYQAAEEITMEKSDDIDQVVLEDVVKGMPSKNIEKDVEELEKNILEDMPGEIQEAEHQVEMKLNGTVIAIEKEVIDEALGVDVDIKDLDTPENDVGNGVATKGVNENINEDEGDEEELDQV